jgi:very long chain acyl-CoA dehydrogenase
MEEEQLDTLRQLLPASQKYFDSIDIQKLDTDECVPDELRESLKDMGVYGGQVSTEYGGLGLNNCQYARMAELGGQGDLGLGIFLGAHQSIGFKGITLFGELPW